MRPTSKAEARWIYSRKCHGNNAKPGKARYVKNQMNRAKRREQTPKVAV